MLQVRLEGDPAEAHAFLDALRAGGVEVQVGNTNNRGGYAHVYAVVRVPYWQAAARPDTGSVRGMVTRGRPIEGGRRP
jgi:hypothetical protein